MPTIESLMSMLPEMFEADRVIGVDKIIQFNVTGLQTSHWTVTVKDGRLNVTKGIHPKPELTIVANSNDLLDIANGKLDPVQAYTQNKLHVTGDPMEAEKLVHLFRIKEHA